MMQPHRGEGGSEAGDNGIENGNYCNGLYRESRV